MERDTFVIVLLAPLIVLFVSVCVLLAVITSTPSTAICPAAVLVIVVSVACQSSIPVNCGESVVASHIIPLTSPSASDSTSPVPAVLLPSILLVAI